MAIESMKFNGQSKESKYLTATLSGYRVFLRYLGFLLFLLPCFVRADVYINEINFNPIGNQNQEWIEIYNSGPDAVDLTGYWLEDRVQWNYYFPVGQTLGAGDYLIVHIGIGVDGPNNVYMGYTTGRLNNSGAELVMRNSANSAIDYVAYGTGSFDPLLGWTNNVNIVGLPPGPTIGFTGTNPATRNNGNNWSSGPHTVGKPNIAPTATIRMNEILPEPGDGHEFFEIYHSGTGNLRDYRLSTGSNSVNDLLLPFYPFTGTGYIVVYLQDLPVDAPPNSVALNLAANRLANAGDSATLRTNFNNSVAAVVAYNSATSGFSPSISTAAPYQSGDSFAFLEVTGNTSTNGNQWINRRGANISAGEVNSEQPAPSIEFGTPDPDGVLGSCQAVTIPLEILYENESWLREVTVTFDLNAIAVTGGDVLFGDFDGGEVGSAYHSGDRVMTWQIGNLTADRDDLAITLIPGTNVTAFTIPPEAVTLTYHRWPGSGAPGTTSPSGPLAEITVNTPALSVEVTEFNTGNPVHSARNGQFVDLRIRVTNSGTGNLPGGSAEINLGSNLRLITVRENNATGPTPPAYSSSPQDGGWDLAAIPAGEFKEYYARVRLAGCLDLNVDVFVFSGCAEGGGNSNDNVVDTSYTIVCPLTVTYTLPTAGVTACEDFEYVINIANSSIFDAQLGNIVIQIPDSFYFMEARDATDNLLDVPGFDGDYDGTVSGGFRTITIQSDSFLAGGILQEANTSIVNGVLVGSPTSTHITLVLRGTCEPASDQKISNQFTYDLGPLNLPVSFETKGVTTDLPVLSVQISDPDDAMNTTVLASRGQEVNFLLEVLNNGSGDLDFSDDPDGALAEIVNVAAGLQIIGVYEGAPVDSETPPAGPNLIDPGNGDFDWRTGPIGSGDKNSYTVRLRVISCNLISFGAQVSYECSGRPDIAIDTCEVPPSFATSAAASIEIELNAPLVNMILPADLEVDYCPENPAANTFEIPFENNGTGPATSLTVEVDGLDLTHYDIQVAANSDFELTTIIGDIAIFTLVDGVDADFDGNTDDLPVDETRFLRFYLELKDNGDGCAAATGGNAMVLVLYGDLCGFEFLGEIDFFDWNLNPRIWSGSLTAAVSQPNPHQRGS